jgi:two-component system sensor histidine kinase/response regulator
VQNEGCDQADCKPAVADRQQRASPPAPTARIMGGRDAVPAPPQQRWTPLMSSQRTSTQAPLVLVVDDQETNIRLVGSVLTRAGFDLMPAMSGEQAFQRLRATQPDAILLDMRMPGMDGFEVLKRLKHDPELADLPVIFVTAAHEREFVVQALDAGAVDYITKPFVEEELVARVRTHTESKLLRDRLRRAIREREEISTVVAHDLKNPLFTISLNAALLREVADQPERVLAIARTIEESAKRSLQFVSSYLEQRADIELRRGYTPQVCDLGLVLTVLLREFESGFAHKQQRLARELAVLEPVLADVEALGVVLRNLLSNAGKYAPPASTVTVLTRRGKPGHLQIAVLDQGPGISASDRSKLFQRFVRLGAEPTGGESSTGLGLASAMQEARWMGGELWYEDAPGGGAAFILELPLAPAAGD